MEIEDFDNTAIQQMNEVDHNEQFQRQIEELTKQLNESMKKDFHCQIKNVFFRSISRKTCE
jgi:hypothetical protein